MIRLRDVLTFGLVVGVIYGMGVAMPTGPRPTCPWSRSHIALRC